MNLKFRIERHERASGQIFFTAEKKKGWFWDNLKVDKLKNGYHCSPGPYGSREEILNLIDEEIEFLNAKARMISGNKIISTKVEYITREVML